MEGLQYLNRLSKLIEENLLTLLPSSSKNLIQNISIHFDSIPHLYLFGKSNMVVNIALKLLVHGIENDNIDINKYVTKYFEHIEFKVYPHYYEIDVHELNHYDKNNVSALVQSLVDHKSVTNRRQIIVFRNISKISKTMETCIKTILDMFVENAFFILVSHTSNTSDIIKSRCCFCNVNIKLENIIFQCLEITRPLLIPVLRSDKDALFFILNKCENDPLNLCILLEQEHPFHFRGYLFGMIEYYFDSMITSKKKSDEKTFNVILRDFVVKLGASAIPYNIISKVIITYLNLYYSHKVGECIPILADMEYSSKTINKQIFTGEHFISCIIHLIVE